MGELRKKEVRLSNKKGREEMKERVCVCVMIQNDLASRKQYILLYIYSIEANGMLDYIIMLLL